MSILDNMAKYLQQEMNPQSAKRQECSPLGLDQHLKLVTAPKLPQQAKHQLSGVTEHRDKVFPCSFLKRYLNWPQLLF